MPVQGTGLDVQLFALLDVRDLAVGEIYHPVGGGQHLMVVGGGDDGYVKIVF